MLGVVSCRVGGGKGERDHVVGTRYTVNSQKMVRPSWLPLATALICSKYFSIKN